MQEYNINEHLKICLQKLKACALCLLMDKGYTKDKAYKAVETIKNFNVYETKTGFKIETLAEGFKTTIFLHTDNLEVKFYSEETKDENDALEQGRIVSAFESQINDRLQKLENQVTNLQTLIQDTSIIQDALTRQHNLKESINAINSKLKWLGENLTSE